jgi:adenylosuccinate lyase
MINRYDVKEISSLWTDEEKFKYYLKVELAHLETLEEEGIAEKGAVEIIKKAKIDVKRILEIERITNHDIIAFCTSITEQFPADFGRFFHFGITSSDVIDTAHALIVKDSMAVIEKDLLELKASLRKKTLETSDLLCIGRSHGISAEAMVFGQKFLSFEAELNRRLEDWIKASQELTGQFSGAVGNYTVLTPDQEEKTLNRLGLKIEAVSSQVIPRDHYAKIISIGSLFGSLFERMAIEFRQIGRAHV